MKEREMHLPTGPIDLSRRCLHDTLTLLEAFVGGPSPVHSK